MNKSSGISTSVIKRLPRYYRFLGDLKLEGMVRISSRELSERMGLTASQIRQDLNCFGGFGQQGYGYNIEQLRNEIGAILGLDKQKKAILIGVGNMGRAIANHMKFETKGFQLIGLFDKKPALTGQMVNGIPIHHTDDIDDFCRENLPTVAILCIPKVNTLDIATQLVKLGVRGFWNFSHYDLTMDFPNITVENVHLGDSLMTLCYNVSHHE
ncbi:MAG: redox-sensing transcriptional repressor Rex [Oscillospiraceae bacterium]